MTTTEMAATRVDYETLYTEVSNGIAVITINRPDVRNAVNRQVQLDIRAALDAFRHDNSVAVVVLTGAGEKAFVAGADIAQVRTYTLHTALSSDLQRLYDAAMRVSGPVYRRLPVPLREAPKAYYLHDMRKRLAT